MAVGEKQVEVLVPLKNMFLEGPKALVTISNTSDLTLGAAEPVEIETAQRKILVAPWGKDNNLPENLSMIAKKNPVARRCLRHKIDIAYGAGLEVGTRTEKGFLAYSRNELKSRFPQVYEFLFEENDINNLLSEIITDMMWYGHSYVEIITDKKPSNERKILYLTNKEAYFSRVSSASPEDPEVKYHLYSAKWPEPEKGQIIVSSIIWSKNPIRTFLQKIGRKPLSNGENRDEKEYRYILPLQITTPGKYYYPEPEWFSLVESGWLDLANAIPEAKKNIMEQALHIKYHIQVHKDYFPRLFAKKGAKTQEEQETIIREFKRDIEEFLKGAKNAGKSWMTFYRTSPDGKEMIEDIKIRVVDVKIGGEYIEDSHEANAMIYTGFGVHPSLIGVIPGKTTSNLSGSDKRELLRIEQSMQKRLRDIILKPLYLTKVVNRWPKELEFAISDIILTTLDSGRETTKTTV